MAKSYLFPIGDPGKLLQRCPYILSADCKLASANARIGTAKADLFPRVSLSGFLGFTARRGSQIGSSSANAWHWTQATLGQRLNWAEYVRVCAVSKRMPKVPWLPTNSK